MNFLFAKRSNSFAAESGKSIITAACLASLTAFLLPAHTNAAVINFPPPGSTAFIAAYEIDSGHSACPNLQCTIVSSTNAPLTLPTTTFTSSNGLTSMTFSGDLGAAAFHSSLTGNVAPEIDLAMKDTYTVHGTATGLFPVTSTFHVTGTASSVPFGASNQAFTGGQVVLNIGVLNIDPAALIPTVDPFGSGPGSITHAQQSLPVLVQSGAFSIPIDVTATYTTMVAVGSIFDIAYFMSSDSGRGTIDLSHTATISFTTPDGIFLSSAMGGQFGDVPTSQTPLPAAWSMMIAGLAGIGGLVRRRRRTAGTEAT